MEDLKNSNDYNDVIPNNKKNKKKVKSDGFVKENKMINIYPKKTHQFTIQQMNATRK